MHRGRYTAVFLLSVFLSLAFFSLAYAQTPSGSASGASGGSGGATVPNANKDCPDPDSGHGYKPGLAYDAQYQDGTVTKRNLYGKTCPTTVPGINTPVQGKCYSPGECKYAGTVKTPDVPVDTTGEGLKYTTSDGHGGTMTCYVGGTCGSSVPAGTGQSTAPTAPGTSGQQPTVPGSSSTNAPTATNWSGTAGSNAPLSNMPQPSSSGSGFPDMLSQQYGIPPSSALDNGNLGYSGLQPGQSIANDLWGTSGSAAQDLTSTANWPAAGTTQIDSLGPANGAGYTGFSSPGAAPAAQVPYTTPSGGLFQSSTPVGVAAAPADVSGFQTPGAASVAPVSYAPSPTDPWTVQTPAAPAPSAPIPTEPESAIGNQLATPGTVPANTVPTNTAWPTYSSVTPANWTGPTSGSTPTASPSSLYPYNASNQIAGGFVPGNIGQATPPAPPLPNAGANVTAQDIVNATSPVNFRAGGELTGPGSLPIATADWVNGVSGSNGASGGTTAATDNFGTVVSSYGNVGWVNGPSGCTDIGCSFNYAANYGAYVPYDPTASQLAAQLASNQGPIAQPPPEVTIPTTESIPTGNAPTNQNTFAQNTAALSGNPIMNDANPISSGTVAPVTNGPAETTAQVIANANGTEQPPTDASTQPTSPYLAAQRAELMGPLSTDPVLRDNVIAVLANETDNTTGATAALESMVNRSIMDGYTSLNQAINSGFYGPVNSGAVDTLLQQGLNQGIVDQGNNAIAAVAAGSNICNFCTDQGMVNEIIGPKTQIGGEYFGYMNGNSSWSNTQVQLQAAYDQQSPTGPGLLASNSGSNPPTQLPYSPMPAGSYFDTALQNGTNGSVPQPDVVAQVLLPQSRPDTAPQLLSYPPLVPVESASLPDITPNYDALVPIPTWDPMNGQQVTADIQNTVNQEGQAAQLADRLAQAPDINTYINSQIPMPDTSTQSGQAVTQDVYNQAIADAGKSIPMPEAVNQSGPSITQAVYDQAIADAGKNIPTPDTSTQSGQAVTQDVYNQAIADAGKNIPVPDTSPVSPPTQKEMWAELLNTQGQSTAPATYSGYYDAVGIPATPQPVSADVIAALKLGPDTANAPGISETPGTSMTPAESAQALAQLNANQTDVASQIPTPDTVPVDAQKSVEAAIKQDSALAYVQQQMLPSAQAVIAQTSAELAAAKNIDPATIVQSDPYFPVTKDDLVQLAQTKYDAAVANQQQIQGYADQINSGGPVPDAVATLQSRTAAGQGLLSQAVDAGSSGLLQQSKDSFTQIYNGWSNLDPVEMAKTPYNALLGTTLGAAGLLGEATIAPLKTLAEASGVIPGFTAAPAQELAYATTPGARGEAITIAAGQTVMNVIGGAEMVAGRLAVSGTSDVVGLFSSGAQDASAVAGGTSVASDVGSTVVGDVNAAAQQVTKVADIAPTTDTIVSGAKTATVLPDSTGGMVTGALDTRAPLSVTEPIPTPAPVPEVLAPTVPEPTSVSRTSVPSIAQTQELPSTVPQTSVPSIVQTQELPSAPAVQVPIAEPTGVSPAVSSAERPAPVANTTGPTLDSYVADTWSQVKQTTSDAYTSAENWVSDQLGINTPAAPTVPIQDAALGEGAPSIVGDNLKIPGATPEAPAAEAPIAPVVTNTSAPFVQDTALGEGVPPIVKNFDASPEALNAPVATQPPAPSVWQQVKDWFNGNSGATVAPAESAPAATPAAEVSIPANVPKYEYPQTPTYDNGQLQTAPFADVLPAPPANGVVVDISNPNGGLLVRGTTDSVISDQAALDSGGSIRAVVSPEDAAALAKMQETGYAPANISYYPVESAPTGSTVGTVVSGDASVAGTAGSGVWDTTKSVASFAWDHPYLTTAGVAGLGVAGYYTYNSVSGLFSSGAPAAAPSTDNGGSTAAPATPAAPVAPAAPAVVPAAAPAAPAAPPTQTPPAPQPRIQQGPAAPQGPQAPAANSGGGLGGALNGLGSILGQIGGAILGKLLAPQTPAATQPSAQTAPTTNPTASQTTSTTPAQSVVTIVANPSMLTSGQKSTLSWSAVGPTQCTVFDPSNAQIGTGSPSGTATTPSLATTTVYSVSCTGGNGPVTGQATVTVQ